MQESLLEEGSSGDKTFYGSEEDEEDEEEKEKKAEAAALAKRKPYVMDPDHRLLLRNTKPLLQSRNAAVRGHADESSSRARCHETDNNRTVPSTAGRCVGGTDHDREDEHPVLLQCPCSGTLNQS